MTAPKDGGCLDAALAYRARGWSVVPVVPREKRPLVRWEPFQHEAASEDRIRAWFRRRPDANVAVVTGAVSDLVVLDVDPRHGGDLSLRGLTDRFGVLPATPEALTGGGGRHLYFRHPGPPLHNRAALLPGLDVRGDGGVIVAPPSLHPNGRRYAWVESHSPDDIDPAALPPWLERLCRGESPEAIAGAGDGGGSSGPGHGRAYWRALLRDGVDAGGRNMTIASLAGYLLHHGIDPQVATELLQSWNRVRCRPPLDDGEVAATVKSIRRTQARAAPAQGGGTG